MTKRNSEKKEVQLRNPFTENFMPAWDGWKAFKKEQFKFTYKPIGEQAALDALCELSAGNEAMATAIIKQSIANGWRGLFTLKNDLNGKVAQRDTQKPTITGNVAPGGFGQF
jgi:hypothetical protein